MTTAPAKTVYQDGVLVSRNPTSLVEVGRVALTPPGAIAAMVTRARSAQAEWSRLRVAERARRMRPLVDALYERMDEIVGVISAECAKPTIEALTSDVFPTMMHLDYLAAKAPRYLRDEHLPDYWISRAMGKSGRIVHRPHGVVAVISPWNFPFWQTAGPALSALIAGNAVIAKPSEYAALSADAFAKLVCEMDLPNGLFQMAHGDGAVGAALVAADVDKIVFTGSASTGRKVMEEAARQLTPVTMELGGVDAAIVLADANLEHAASGIVWAGFTCAGQVCASVERVYAEAPIADEFKQLVLAKTRALRVGAAMGGVDIGSMNNERQFAVVRRQVEEAIARGARVLAGGKAGGPGQWFFEPTVLEHVPEDTELMRTETFGPVIAIETVADAAEAIRLTNAHATGLTASLWTRDVPRARKLARDLHVGTVSINDHLSSAGLPDMPWGGTKESGFGRLQGRAGLMTFVIPQVITSERYPLKRMWWFNYDQRTFEWFRGLAGLLTQRGPGQKMGDLRRLLSNFSLRRLL